MYKGGILIKNSIKENIHKYYGIILVIFIGLIAFKVLENHRFFFHQVKALGSMLVPFFWAFAIAYLLNPFVMKLEAKFRLKRTFSMLIAYLLLLGIIAGLLTIVIPVIARNILDITAILPEYLFKMQTTVLEQLDELTVVQVMDLEMYIKENINQWTTNIFSYIDILLNGLVGSLVGITTGVFKFVLGLIISIYMIYDKEKFISSIKRVLNGVFGYEKGKAIVEFGNIANSVFSNFFIGKAIDSLIIGVICFVGLYLLKVPFAALMSIIVGIWNMVPYFGPFIGAIPVVIITFFYSPIKALWVVLFIFLLQQFDGYILGPKILGDKLGITPFYIILAIMIGGGYFGVLGMLFGVPVLKLGSILLDRYLDKRLNRWDDLESKNIN